MKDNLTYNAKQTCEKKHTVQYTVLSLFSTADLIYKVSGSFNGDYL